MCSQPFLFRSCLHLCIYIFASQLHLFRRLNRHLIGMCALRLKHLHRRERSRWHWAQNGTLFLNKKSLACSLPKLVFAMEHLFASLTLELLLLVCTRKSFHWVVSEKCFVKSSWEKLKCYKIIFEISEVKSYHFVEITAWWYEPIREKFKLAIIKLKFFVLNHASSFQEIFSVRKCQ